MNIMIVNPNPVFDRTVLIPELVPGAVIRTLQVELTAGGKGINVARVLRSLQLPAPLLIPVGREDAARYAALLADEGADSTLIEVAGPIRNANIYLEQKSDRVTVVNDAGHPMSVRDWELIHTAIVERAQSNDLVLIMGSFPPALHVDALPALIDALHQRGAYVLLDVNPEWLSASLMAQPDLITPNLDEAEAALNNTPASVMAAHHDEDRDVRIRAESAAAELCQRGARRVFVTAGAAGVAMASADGMTWTPAISVEAVSTVGAGDSFVAGVVSSLVNEPDLADCDWHRAIVFGVASAAASCENVRAGGVTAERIHALVQPLLEGASR